MKTERRGHQKTAPEARNHVLSSTLPGSEATLLPNTTQGRNQLGTELQSPAVIPAAPITPANSTGRRIHSALKGTVPSWGGSGTTEAVLLDKQ